MRGFQVAPAEIEAVLHGHPAVEDCAVFGVPDAADGEAIVAAVELLHGARSRPTNSSRWSATGWRRTNDPAGSCSSPKYRACHRERCCAEC